MSRKRFKTILSLVIAFTGCCFPVNTQESNPDLTVRESITFGQPLQDKINALATLLSEAFRERKFERVVVLGAHGPGDDLSQFGSELGDLLSADLGRLAADVQIEDRNEIRRYLRSQRISPAMVQSDALGPMICAEFNAKGWIKAELSKPSKDSIALNVHLFPAGKSDAKSVAGWRIELQLDSALELARMRPVIPREDFAPGPQNAAKKGWTEPRCEFCPRPDYTAEARHSGFQGEMHFSAVVTLDGSVEDIAVVKAGRYDLNLAAINSIKTWKLRPATDEKSKPVQSRVDITVKFELF